VEFTIDELTALVLEHGRRAIQARKTAEELLKLAAEDDRLAQVYLEAGKRVNRQKEEQESKMNIRRIISGVSVLLLVLMVFSFALSSQARTLAQDVPGATATMPVQATVNGQPVEATLEPVSDQPTESHPDNTALILSTLKDIILYGGLVFLAFKTGKLIPAESVKSFMESAFDFGKQLANQTTTPIDNDALKFFQPIIEQAVIAALAKRDAAPAPPAAVNITIPPMQPVDLTPQV
jgi:hypothetical protein